MWRAWAEDADGQVSEIRVAVRSGVPISTALVLEAVQEIITEGHGPIHLVEKEKDISGQEPLPGRDSITVWGAGAAGSIEDTEKDFHDEIGFLEGRALAWFDGNDLHRGDPSPRGLVWHDNTVVVVPVRDDYRRLSLQYVPELEDQAIKERFEQRYGSTRTFLEWRGYFGENSIILDGFLDFVQRAELRLAEAAGFVVGMVVHHIGRTQETFENDPLYRWRQKRLAKRFPNIVTDCLNLASSEQPVSSKACIVVIHGTASCGFNVLADLYPGSLLVPTYRYEHDTFRSIVENAKELADLLTQKINAERLLLIAHSRGGLVARVALHLLERQAHPPFIDLWTYGTPYGGTPLVDAGASVLGLLYRAGNAIIEKGIPKFDFASAAFSYLLKPRTLPKGISDMSPSSTFLELLRNLKGAGIDLRSYGSVFDMSQRGVGYGLAFGHGFGKTAFGGEDNDLIVPTRSAMNAGDDWTKNTVGEHCSHFAYFASDSVRRDIQLWSAHWGNVSLPTARLGQEIDNRIGWASDKSGRRWVVIGGCRLRVK